jgi:hypothetical protein
MWFDSALNNSFIDSHRNSNPSSIWRQLMGNYFANGGIQLWHPKATQRDDFLNDSSENLHFSFSFSFFLWWSISFIFFRCLTSDLFKFWNNSDSPIELRVTNQTFWDPHSSISNDHSSFWCWRIRNWFSITECCSAFKNAFVPEKSDYQTGKKCPANRVRLRLLECQGLSDWISFFIFIFLKRNANILNFQNKRLFRSEIQSKFICTPIGITQKSWMWVSDSKPLPKMPPFINKGAISCQNDVFLCCHC